MSSEPQKPNAGEWTDSELADIFAAQVVKSALKPAPDGLQVFDLLVQKPATKTT